MGVERTGQQLVSPLQTPPAAGDPRDAVPHSAEGGGQGARTPGGRPLCAPGNDSLSLNGGGKPRRAPPASGLATAFQSATELPAERCTHRTSAWPGNDHPKKSTSTF